MKFEVGEIAMLLIGDSEASEFAPGGLYGSEVEIIRVGPFPRGTKSSYDGAPTHRPQDYEIAIFDGSLWFCDESDLRKRYPPGSDIARDIMANTPKEVEAA